MEDPSESESEEDAYAWDKVYDLALARAVAQNARIKSAEVRYQDA